MLLTTLGFFALTDDFIVRIVEKDVPIPRDVAKAG